MDDFLEVVFNLDKNNDYFELIRFVSCGPCSPRVVAFAVSQLLRIRRIRSAFILSKFLVDNGYQDPIIAVALSVGGLIYGVPEEEARGLEMLRVHASSLSPGQQKFFYDHIVVPVVLNYVLLWQGLDHWTSEHVQRIIEIVKAAVPYFRTMFDWSAPSPTLSLDGLRRQGHEKSRILRYSLPPVGVPRQDRRVVVAATTGGWRGKGLSPVGSSWVAAFNAYGWHAELCSVTNPVESNSDHWIADCRGIVESCQRHDAEILMIDMECLLDGRFNDSYDMQVRNRLLDLYGGGIAHLRQWKPSIKVVGYLMDSWGRGSAIMTEAAVSLFDVIIASDAPSLPLWSRPYFANKLLHIFVPYGNLGGSDQPLVPQMLLHGSISTVAPFRALWLSAIDKLGLPVRKSAPTSMFDDLLTTSESYAVYRRRLVDATCCLSFSMRYNQALVVTHRVFEVPLSGALLVQEFVPDIYYYFTPGEHYLEFSSVAELSAIACFITEKREEAEEIRRCGHVFAKEHYSDERLIGYIEKMLYFPD